MKEVIKNIFDKVDFGIIVGTIYLSTVVFVLIPKSIMEHLKLLVFKEKWQFVISIVFVILTCYYISLIINYVKKRVGNKMFKRNLKKIMKNITGEEKQYIMAFCDFEAKTFKTSCDFDMSDATVNLLESRGVISRGSNVSKGFTIFGYFLQPWAYEYLTEQLEKGNISIEDNKFRW